VTNIITPLINKFVKIWLKYRIQSKFNKIKELTSNDSLDLFIIFDKVYEHYSTILKSKGFKALWIEVEAVREEIRSLNLNMLDKKHKTLSERTIQRKLYHLNQFKDILTKVKFTVELLLLVKIVLGYINKYTFIPILILAIWLWIRKLYIGISLLFTSSFATAYFTNHYDYISKTFDFLLRVKLILRKFAIRAYNWLFNDDLISRSDIQSEIDHMKRTLETLDSLASNGIIEILKERANKALSLPKYFDLPNLESLSNPIIDWSLASYVIGASLLTITIGTSYLAYTGTITPSSIYNGVKVIGSAIWGFMSYFGFDSDDSNNPKDPGNSGNIGGGASAGPSAIRPSVVGEVEVDEVAIKEAWLKTLTREDRGKAREVIYNPGSTKPAAINVGLGDKIDLPLDSAGISWRLPNLFRLRESQGSSTDVEPLIEVTPSSPTGSVDSNRTIKAVEGGPGYPNIVIYPPTSNNNNEPPFLTTELIPNGLVVPSTLGSTYPDPNLGVWEPIYLKYSCGVATPESYEHFTALNERFPNLTPLELEDICNKIKSGDNSIFKDY
jgi:hypothetical protein